MEFDPSGCLSMSCNDFRADLSCHMDDALEAKRAVQVEQHLRECPGCDWEFNRLAQLRDLLQKEGRVEPPPELALALRVRLSQESQLSLLDRLGVRIRNLMAPVAVPAFAGLIMAVLLFGVLIHTFSIPTPALTDDIPLVLLNTPPKLRASAVEPLGFNTGDEGIVVEIRVNREGQVEEYRVLSGHPNPAELSKLKRVLVFTRFDPATTFGVPRPATTVINFSSISVKG